MHCIEGQVTKEGLLLVFLDKADGFVGKEVGEMFVRLERFAIVLEFRVLAPTVRMCAAEKANKLVKAAGVGYVVLVITQVPLAE